MICSNIMREQEFKSTIFIFLFIIYGVISTPPADPIQCSSNNKNCTITNSNGVFPDRSICRASEVMYPTTEAELISIVALASKNNRKMKVATRYSHSIPKLACPDDNGLLISTKNLNRVLKIDVKVLRMTVESGVTLREIINEAARFEMALPNTPYWWGLTIGGLISTGAHGSTLWGKGSAVHEYVTQIRIVSPAGCEDGYAKVRNLNESHQDLNAARVSLGVLGVISQVCSFYFVFLVVNPSYYKCLKSNIYQSQIICDFRILILLSLNPFGVGLVVGLGSWSLLLQRSQVRFPLVSISVG